MAQNAYPNNWDTAIFPGTTGDTPAVLSGYLPLLFARETLRKFYDDSILPRIVNVSYQRELMKFGSKIFVRQRPQVQVRDYTVGTDLQVDQLTAPAPIEVVIDKAKYWAYAENDLTTQQTDLKGYMNEAVEEARNAMQDAIEPAVLADLVAQAAAANVGNTGATAGAKTSSYDLGTAANPIQLNVGDASASNVLADLYGVLKEQNVITKGAKPFAVIPNRFLNMLSKSALSAANISGDGTPIVRRGQDAVGIVQGLELYPTNYLEADGTNTDAFPVLCGTQEAVTFAMQVTKMEKIRAQKQFADFVRGLSVYGYKLIQPKALALAWVRFKPASA